MQVGTDGRVRVKMAHPNDPTKQIHRRVFPIDAAEIVKFNNGVLDPDPRDTGAVVPTAESVVEQATAGSPAAVTTEELSKYTVPQLKQVAEKLKLIMPADSNKKQLVGAVHEAIGSKDEFEELFGEFKDD